MAACCALHRGMSNADSESGRIRQTRNLAMMGERGYPFQSLRLRLSSLGARALSSPRQRTGVTLRVLPSVR